MKSITILAREILAVKNLNQQPDLANKKKILSIEPRSNFCHWPIIFWMLLRAWNRHVFSLSVAFVITCYQRREACTFLSWCNFSSGFKLISHMVFMAQLKLPFPECSYSCKTNIHGLQSFDLSLELQCHTNALVLCPAPDHDVYAA